jgi:uncharacterized membrane protein YgaE (UPF0421/DUF939 family)
MDTDPVRETSASEAGLACSRFHELSSKIAQRLANGTQQGIISAVAAVVAYVPTQSLGINEGFWGAITAIAVVQTEFQATQSTARDQFVGAAVGGLIALCLLLALGNHLLVYAAAVLLAILACWALNVGTACRLAGITATIILLVPHSSPPERMLISRLSEVAWGVCVAIAVVWLAARLPISPLSRIRGK